MTSTPSWLAPLAAFFKWLRRHGSVIWISRVSFFTAVILLLLFILPDQSRDLFRAILQDLHAGHRQQALRVLVLFFVSGSGALSLWFWSRQSLRLLSSPNASPWLEQHLPRLCAVVPFATMGVLFAAVKAGPVLPAKIGLSVAFVGGGAVLYFLLYVRRRTKLLSWSDTPRAYLWIGWGGAVLAGLVFTAALVVREYAYQFGAIGVLWLGAAMWVTILGALVIHGTRHGIPWVMLMGILGFVLGKLNVTDNHAVRSSAQPARPGQETADVSRTSVREGFRAWRKLHPSGKIIFVAAEGGGIYAAHHAAYLLTKLQEKSEAGVTDPSFADRVFMISSISGGSVGSGVFLGLAAAEKKRGRGSVDFVDSMHLMLDEDLLSPALAAGVGPDAAQIFLPFHVAAFDRARALEDTLAHRWSDVEAKFPGGAPSVPVIDWSTGGNGSYWKLWLSADGSLSADLPALFLNTTVVETGGRAILSPYGLPTRGERSAPAIAHLWAGAPDLRIPIPTAIFMSARFPVVTPVARLNNIALRPSDGEMSGETINNWRFADGGYFENSGIDTLYDVLSDLLAVSPEKGAPLLLASDVNVLVITSVDDTTGANNGEGLSEFLSPLNALLRTRSERAKLADARLKVLLRGNGIFTSCLRLKGNDESAAGKNAKDAVEAPDIPLGWTLSISSRRQIEAQVNAEVDQLWEKLSR